MKKDKRKMDKEQFKGLLILVLGVSVVAGVFFAFLFRVLCSILEFQISLSIQIVCGLLCAVASGFATGLSIKDGWDNNNYEEEIEYEEYELEDEMELGEEFVQENVPSLKVVKGRGSNYTYEFKSNERPKLEVLKPDDNQTSKKR